jgi:hypothetical protein
MVCQRTGWPRLLLAALAAALLGLWIPATSHAAERDRLASAGLLERGSGYGSPAGSDAVRTLQSRLRRLGARPGPIDGLYGPLTQGAVERFQQRHGLAVDGIVGRQTKRSLLARVSHPVASPAQRNTQPGTLERKSPAPNIGSESAERPHARPVPADAASRDGPASGTSGVPPELIAALAGLAALLLLVTLRKQGEVRLNLGLTCAALLGVFGIGAVAGALFATRAAPPSTDRETAQSGLLLTRAAARAAPRRRVSAARPAHTKRHVAVAKAPAPAASVATAAAPAGAVASTPAPPAAPAPAAARAAPVAPRPARRTKPSAYVVELKKLSKLNLDRRLRSGKAGITGASVRLR